jgi:hypothetical protein
MAFLPPNSPRVPAELAECGVARDSLLGVAEDEAPFERAASVVSLGVVLVVAVQGVERSIAPLGRPR